MGPAIVVSGDATLREVAALMLRQQVQGVLVVNARGEVAGVVTERHITLDDHYLNMATLRASDVGGRPLTRLDGVDAGCIAARTLKAGDVMDRHVTRASAEEPVGASVERMLRRDAEYAVVVDGASVVGVLSGRDLLRRMAGIASPTQRTPSGDDKSMPIRIRPERKLLGWLVGGPG